MKLPGVFLLALLCCWAQRAGAQPAALDEHTFRAMSDAERYRFVHDFSFEKIGSATAHHMLKRMKEIAQENSDTRSALVTDYRMYVYATMYPTSTGTSQGWDVVFDALANFDRGAKQSGFEVEEVVGRFYHNFELFNYERLGHEKVYVVVQETVEKMEAMGFERFEDYRPELILVNCCNFMWDLEDYEEAYQYLSFAERVLQPTEENQPYLTPVLSRLQSYWQDQKKDYPKAIEYAQKIRHFYQNVSIDDPKEAWRSRFWQGFPLLSIAEMRLAQGDTAGVEVSADEGYALTKFAEDNTDIYAHLAEYEALQVYIPIKMAFGKLDEAGRLLQRAAYIKERMGLRWEVDVFKHIKFYRNYARYHEVRGNAAEALRYTQRASVLQDSLHERNDARKFERLKQRLEIEKHTAKLRLVESEREFHKSLRNAAFIILALVLLLLYMWLHRQRYIRAQKEAELTAARVELTTMTHTLLEKADMVENLRLEIERLSIAGEHSQYLDQLLAGTILTEEDWQRFRAVFEKAFPGFLDEQKIMQPGLTPAELRYLALEKLQLSTREMARMLGVSDNTVRQTRARLRRKAPAPLLQPHPRPLP